MRYVYVLFACICLCDYLWHRIPNGLVAAVFALGEWVSYSNTGLDGLLAFNGIALFTCCAFYLFFQLGALGAGDVKLFAATAGFFGPGRVPVYLFVGLLAAGCVGAAKILVRGKTQEKVGVCLAGPMFLSFVLVGGLFG